MKFRLTLALLLLIQSVIFYGQSVSRHDADSMLLVLNRTNNNSDRVPLLLGIAQYHIFKPGENKIDFDSANTYINAAAGINKTLKSPDAYGYQLLTQAYMSKEKGPLEEARKITQQAIDVLATGKNKSYLGRAYFQLSLCYDYRDSTELNLKKTLVQKSIDFFQQAGDLKWKGISLEMLGELYGLHDEFEKSIEILKQAVVVYESINHPTMQGVYVSLGEAYQYQQDYNQALLYMLKAMKIANASQDTTMQLCRINNILSGLYYRIDRKELALRYSEEAYKIAVKHDDKYIIFTIIIGLETNYNDLGRPQDALKILNKIPKEYAQATDGFTKMVIAHGYLNTYINLKQYHNAKPYNDSLLKFTQNKRMGPKSRANILSDVCNVLFP